jgi:hypothetical protein
MPVFGVWTAYPCCLEDFAKAGEVINAGIEGGDGIIEKL